MHHMVKKSAIEKYGNLVKEGKKKEEIELELIADEKGFTSEEVKELLEALFAEAPSKPTPELSKQESKAKHHEHYTHYDEFEAFIRKENKFNPYVRKNEQIITGWELGKKLRSTLIEPHLAKELNAFAHGMDNHGGDGGRGKIYLPQGQYNRGDILKYEDWAKEQGINAETDPNVLFAKLPNPAH
jgi:phage major head subunit gpT-like protein